MIFFIIDTVPFSKIRKTGKFSTKTKRKVEKCEQKHARSDFPCFISVPQAYEIVENLTVLELTCSEL
jgi:hypothetical protein